MKKRSRPAIMRSDVLLSNMTAHKEVEVREVLAAYRKGAKLIAQEQWRLFFQVGSFNRVCNKKSLHEGFDEANTGVVFKDVIGSAARVQMCRFDVVGQLKSWISNRANDFTEIVVSTTFNAKSVLGEDQTSPQGLSEEQITAANAEIKHMLHTINRLQAWFVRRDVVMNGTGEVIPDPVRRLARSIMRHVMKRCRKPSFANLGMRLDDREARRSAPTKATQKGRVAWWVRMPTMTRRQVVTIPLLKHDLHQQRNGEISDTVLVTTKRETGELRFVLATDMAEAYAESKAAYEPKCELVSLDFGLCTMFATDDGDLLGQNWLKALTAYDKRINDISRGLRCRGQRKLRDNKRYRAAVQDMQGFIKTEVNRVLNRLIEQKKPEELVLERLDFSSPHLSRRLNRIIQNCGRSVVRQKLADLKDRLGVTSTEVNPAYTSRECNSCGYVDKRNRPSRDTFRCLWCGKRVHSDVSGSRSIKGRRALSIGSVNQSKEKILVELVRRFDERWAGRRQPGGHGSTADPRLSNPYWERAGGPRALNKSKTNSAFFCW